MRAVIIGAGIAGLSTTLRLHQAGWETLLVERAPARRDGGYAVTFGGIGYDAAERIGILSDLQARSFETTELSYHRSDGSRLFALDRATIAATTGARSLTILRGDLESVLYERVRDHTTIRFGTTLTSFEQDDREVRVALTDGTVETADLLIGADGLHSATRTLLFGPEEDFLVDLQHKIAVSMLDRRPASIAPGTTGTHSSRGRTVAVISAGDGRNVAFFGYRADHARPGADVHTELRRIYGDLGWIIPKYSPASRKPTPSTSTPSAKWWCRPGARVESRSSATPRGASRCSPATAHLWPWAERTGSSQNSPPDLTTSRPRCRRGDGDPPRSGTQAEARTTGQRNLRPRPSPDPLAEHAAPPPRLLPSRPQLHDAAVHQGLRPLPCEEVSRCRAAG